MMKPEANLQDQKEKLKDEMQEHLLQNKELEDIVKLLKECFGALPTSPEKEKTLKNLKANQERLSAMEDKIRSAIRML